MDNKSRVLIGKLKYYPTLMSKVGRKPVLQFKVLSLLAKNGKMSKSMAESLLVKHNHPEIFEAFKNWNQEL